ncbi:MAG: SDR family NAD(P)-dependent oxidoreductase [Vicinamibacterales bacterium]
MNTVVAITGASAGIGRATAARLAREGASVAICARRADTLEAVADELRRAGGRVVAIPADVTRADDMARFVAATQDAFGRIDVMMCNAGFGIYGEIDRVTPEQMQQLMDVNFTGTFLAARAALPIFRAQASGHIIVVSSIVGRRGVPFMGPVRGNEVRAGGARGVSASRAAGFGYPRLGGLSDLDRDRVPRCDAAAFRVRHARERPTPVARPCGRHDRSSDSTADTGGLSVSSVEGARTARRHGTRSVRSTDDTLAP